MAVVATAESIEFQIKTENWCFWCEEVGEGVDKSRMKTDERGTARVDKQERRAWTNIDMRRCVNTHTQRFGAKSRTETFLGEKTIWMNKWESEEWSKMEKKVQVEVRVCVCVH